MRNTGWRHVLRGLLVALTLIAVMAATAGSTLAAKPDVPPGRGGGIGGGRGNGGGGGPGEETAANNLSVPAVFAGIADDPFGLTCDGATFVEPTGTPLTGYTLPGYYYVQKVHTWQAQCAMGTMPSVTADWGDNLVGEAQLKVGSPIRVELGLFDSTTGMTGFVVDKLEPDQLDRLSPYGTLATQQADGTFKATAQAIGETRVWANGTHLTISPVVGDVAGTAIVDEAAKAEINSTGRIVYGYNLRVPAPGTYRIVFDVPAALVTGVALNEEGEAVGSYTDHSVTLDIVVGTGGGGGGGKNTK